mmetsp:Transcript_33722/g.73616  ORF Transcript_33722/g.73616 Transcript_33722/m.73616 type:complete len:922 (-) Transcript_33722:2039-4804(-)
MHREGLRGAPGELLQLLHGGLLAEGLRHLAQQVLRRLVHQLLGGHAPAAAARLGHRLDDGVQAVAHLEGAEGEIGVGVEAEDLGGLLRGELLDGLAEGGDLGEVGHVVPGEELVPLLQRLRVEVLLRVGVHHQLVHGVRDAPAVLDLRDHVPHRGPGGLARLLGVHLHEMVLQELRARHQVRLVELVRHVPPDGAELAALLDGGVQEAHDVEDLAPLVALHDVEHVLGDPAVAVPQPRLHAHGRLVGDLDAHLQQPDGELRVGLRRDPQAEVLVDLLRLDQELLHLVQVGQAQVHVLQQHPLALQRGRGHVLARNHLLALAHAHAVRLDLLLLGEVLDQLGGVRARGQQADERAAAHRLQPGGLHVEGHRLDEHAAERVGDVVLRGDERAVLAHGAHHAHLLELVDLVLVVGHLRLLRRLLVVPLPPEAVVAVDALLQVEEDAVGAERHAVQPRLVGQPLLGLLAHGGDVQAGAALEEDGHVLHLDHLGAHQDLVGEHEREHQLVALEEPALDVQVDVVREELHDVDDALRGHCRLGRVIDGVLVQLVELPQRRLVHAVHRGELRDEEVHQRGAVRHRAVLLARLRDLRVRVRCHQQLLVHVLRRLLRHRQHVDELRVVQQVAGRVGQAEEQIVLELLDLLLVVLHLLDEGEALLLQLVLLLEDELAQQLVLQAHHGHGEVDHRHLGAHLGGVVRVGQAGGAEHVERVAEVHLLVRQLDDVALALAHEALLEHGVQHRVQRLLNVLDQHRLTEGHTVLQVVAELLLHQRGDAQHVLLLAVLDPREALPLGVHQHGVARGARHHDAVLDGELVGGQALHVPLAHLRVLHQELGHLQVLRHRDGAHHAVSVEVAREQDLAELLVEGAEVRDEGGGQRAVARQALDLVLKLLRLLRPAGLLPAQRGDERVGAVHLLLGGHGIVL